MPPQDVHQAPVVRQPQMPVEGRKVPPEEEARVSRRGRPVKKPSHKLTTPNSQDLGCGITIPCKSLKFHGWDGAWSDRRSLVRPPGGHAAEGQEKPGPQAPEVDATGLWEKGCLRRAEGRPIPPSPLFPLPPSLRAGTSPPLYPLPGNFAAAHAGLIRILLCRRIRSNNDPPLQEDP